MPSSRRAESAISTHTPRVRRDHPNHKMDKSPLNDDKQSYMRRQAIVAPVTEYENPRNGSMSQNDYDYAKQVADKAKQKYIDKKNEKNGKKK